MYIMYIYTYYIILYYTHTHTHHTHTPVLTMARTRESRRTLTCLRYASVRSLFLI